MRSDAVTTTLTFLSEKINTVTETSTFLDPDVCGCCYINRVFGHQTLTEITDPFKNDITRFLRGYESSIDTVDMFLTKPNDSTFSDVALINDTFGQFFALGFHTGLGRNYIGYEINWRLVLIAHGEGEYQIRADKTSALYPSLASDLDFSYDLQNFTAARADTTIRISFENSHLLRSRFDQKKRISFPDNWTNQIRLKGILKSLGSEYNKTFIKYKDESKRTIEDEQVPKYFMRIEQATAEIHDYIRTEVMQSDVRKVTDYNRNNPWKYEDIEIIEPSEYKPENESEEEQLMDVEIEFRDRFDTGLKKRC